MKERPARGDNHSDPHNQKSLIYRPFRVHRGSVLASICQNGRRTCGNSGKKLTQPCSPAVLPSLRFAKPDGVRA